MADGNNNDLFIKEVAKYFMNFLETDFHKTRLPKRNSISKIIKGHKVGLDLDKYKKLKKDFYTIFYNGFKKDSINVKKGNYTSNISENIFNLISSNIKKIEDNLLDITFSEIEINLIEIKKVHIKNYQLYLEKSQDTIQKIFTKHFIIPFLDTIEEPLQTLELVDQNGLYQIEGDLSDSLYSVFDNVIISILQSFFEYDQKIEINKGEREENVKPFNLISELKENILITELKANIELFFKNISVSDAFDDIYILFKNNKLLDKTELYLYMYEISANSQKFPLFYLPIKLEEKKGSFELIFDQKLYVNTKAIDYVVQEYNRGNPENNYNKGKGPTLAGNYDRIIYINDDDNFIEKVKWISDSIQNFFKFNKSLDSENSEFQKVEHILTSFSNKSYIYLFDKSDESVINDYEEILNNKDGILEQFSLLLNDFVENNPKNFEEEIHDEWVEKSVANKLVFESPIPLNDEQKQVILALENPECKVLTLEGPPGTGKSHTITAIICKALLNGKSVLVLSDKKEALDVVESKITETLNKVRKDDDFLNPILRLGKSGNKFGKIVQGQTINKIAEHYSAYKHKKLDLDKEKINLIKNIEKNIGNNIDYYNNILMDEIKFYYNNLKEFSNFNLYSRERDLEIDLLKLKKLINKINELGINNINNNLINNYTYDVYKKYINKLQALKEINNNYFQDFDNIGPKYLAIVETDLKLDISYHKKKGIALAIMKDSIEKIKNSYDSCNELSSILPKFDIGNEQTYILLFNLLYLVEQLIPKTKKFIGDEFSNYFIFKNFIINNFEEKLLITFETHLDKIVDFKTPIFGYLFKGKKLDKEIKMLKSIFPYISKKNLNSVDTDLELVLNLMKFIFNSLDNNEREAESFLQIWNLLIYLLSNKFDYISLKESSEQVLDIFETYKLDKEFLDIDELIHYNNWYLDISKNVEKLKLLGDKLLGNNIKGLISSKYFGDKLELINATGLIDNCKQFAEIDILKKYLEDINYIKLIYDEHKDLSSNINLVYKNENITDISSDLEKYSDEFIEKYINFKKIEFKLKEQFSNIPKDIFSDGIKSIEEQTTAEMAYFLDQRIVDYSRNYSNEVNTLKGIISKKKKFPKGLFKNLKNAFPCILAGIRDYSDYIPLEKDLFDLIIIDEASQVSIAQSLPALIRGKKIIILGDDKQFSNVKSNNASKIVNQEYKTNVRKTFIEENLAGKEDEFGWLENVGNFDIKYSILKFSKSIQNYKCQLRKHFRGYPEIISYSNKFFYEGSLQCMKIRGKPVEDVIKIDVIPHDGLIDITKNTNELEINYIIQKILEFKEKGIVQSLGIITPHQHQASLLHDRIDALEEKDWIKKICKLKIMTFDSCQGEERDYIFYSMVATEEKDRLIYVFIKDLNSIDTEEDGSVKAQRMNVGFSRAKECMHFVLSKPINNFSGEIKNALLHYKNELEAGKKVSLGGTDENSPMEVKIQKYFYETQFYKDNNNTIEFIPQFDIGKYLRQLDRTYNHPAYKVDFLLIYNNKKIVIEYDGFKEHFEDIGSVDKYNYESYMKADDIYRQKVLEGYGYKFLRINRFNIGDNPVDTLDIRLNELFKKKSLNNESLESLYEQIEKLHDGDERACVSCGNIFESKYFPYKTKDECVDCYEKLNGKTLRTFRRRLNYYEKNTETLINSDDTNDIGLSGLNCPSCNSTNIKSKGYRNDKKRLLCGTCERNWSVLLVDTINNTVKPLINKKEDTFERENTLEEIRDYLKIKESNGRPITFYYREKSNMDTFYNYYFDDTYLHVKTGNSRYYIKYLIDKVRKVV